VVSHSHFSVLAQNTDINDNIWMDRKFWKRWTPRMINDLIILLFPLFSSSFQKGMDIFIFLEELECLI
jgi:hypothetical protein